MQSGQRFGSWEKMYSLTPGNQREPDMLPTREKRSVRQMAYSANSPPREYPAIPRHRGTPEISLSAVGMISSVRSRRQSSAPPVQGSACLKAGGLSHGAMSRFQSRLLMDTKVNGGQPAACAASQTFRPSSEKVLRQTLGAVASRLGKMDIVLPFVDKVYIA